MNRLLAPLLLLVLLVTPLLASAQSNLPLFDPDWQLVPDAHEIDSSCLSGAPLGFGGVLQLIQNGMNAAVSFGIVICVIIIAFAGMLWILTPTNPENHSQAKKVLTNAVIGFLIILSAWLVVDFVMKLLYNGDNTNFGPWNEILTGGDVCIIAQNEPPPIFDGNITAIPGRSTGSSAGGGVCPAPPANQNNHCSISTLQRGCFGNRATEASRICMLESGGGVNPAIKSGSDRLNGGSGPAYSVGLWQVNLTVHRVDGLNCPAAFTTPCGPRGTLVGPSKPGACYSSIKPGMQGLYSRCVLAAQNAEKNTAVACRLYSARDANGGFQPWIYSANICNIPAR